MKETRGRPKGKTSKYRNHSIEFKLEVVKKHLDEHYSLLELASKYQLSSGMISHWVKKYLESGETSLESKKKGRHCQGITNNNDLSEIEQLKLELLKKDIEIERLKKGYTVKGVGSKKEYVTILGKTIK